MSALYNIRRLQSLSRVPNVVEVTCSSFKRFKSSRKWEPPELPKPRVKEETEDESIWSAIFNAGDPRMPLPVELRKRFYRKYGFTDHYKDKERKIQRAEQMYNPERHAALGPDLAAAHFVLFRKGGVKFSHLDKWIYQESELDEELPILYDERYVLTGVDISNLNLRPEALTNFKDLTKLSHLSMKNSPRADDWWLDTISGELQSIRHIDISGCSKITYRGISILYRLKKLESLIVEGIQYSPFLEMTLLELEDIFPDLKIYGFECGKVEKPEKNGDSEVCKISN